MKENEIVWIKKGKPGPKRDHVAYIKKHLLALSEYFTEGPNGSVSVSEDFITAINELLETEEGRLIVSAMEVIKQKSR